MMYWCIILPFASHWCFYCLNIYFVYIFVGCIKNSWNWWYFYDDVLMYYPPIYFPLMFFLFYYSFCLYLCWLYKEFLRLVIFLRWCIGVLSFHLLPIDVPIVLLFIFYIFFSLLLNIKFLKLVIFLWKVSIYYFP